MSKRSEEIAAKIKALKEEEEKVTSQLKQEQGALGEKLSIQNAYDTYVAGTQNATNGANIRTTEGDYPVVETDVGKSIAGEPYARIVKLYGDPKYDDDYSYTNTYIVPNGENATIAVLSFGLAGTYFRIYSYDTKKEDSELLLKANPGEPVPEEFVNIHDKVEGMISDNTQDAAPAE